MTDRNGGGQIAEELRALVSDAETLLRSTTNAGGADAQERAQILRKPFKQLELGRAVSAALAQARNGRAQEPAPLSAVAPGRS